MNGPGNLRLSPPARSAITEAVRAALGERLVETGAAADDDLPHAPGIARAETVGRRDFTRAEIDRIAAPLRRIRGRSITNHDGAFCVVTMSSGLYVQFLARTDRPWFWTEICSHRYQPRVARYLGEELVSFLEACGFSWPLEVANFGRSLPGRTDADCERAAAFALGALRSLFAHVSGCPLEIFVHVPTGARVPASDSGEPERGRPEGKPLPQGSPPIALTAPPHE